MNFLHILKAWVLNLWRVFSNYWIFLGLYAWSSKFRDETQRIIYQGRKSCNPKDLKRLKYDHILERVQYKK